MLILIFVHKTMYEKVAGKAAQLIPNEEDMDKQDEDVSERPLIASSTEKTLPAKNESVYVSVCN